MKKFLTLTGLMLLVAATAMAGVGEDRLFVQPNATFATGAPTTTNNDDSCDIAVQPAATLLLPYFEVDVNEPRATAQDTNFTIVNTSELPQIAHITIWTDWSFPVIDFNIFLTGYDVQGLSLYDIIVRGQIPPTTNATTTTSPGPLSAANNANPVHYNLGTCTALPGPIPSDLAAAIRSALTTGTYPGFGCTVAVGGNHPSIATGYVTVDVARTCGTGLPIDESYFLNEIAFDNTLTGDYMYINPDAATGNFAGATPLVHIRAIPEGGIAGDFPTNLPFTFYDRYTTAANDNIDRRQPLPGTFAARFISAGTETFDTDYNIWREGPIGRPSCVSTTATNAVRNNSNIAFTTVVRFDESENPQTRQGGVIISPAPAELGTPEAFRRDVNDTLFPQDFAGTADLGGWMYMNLNNGASGAYGAGRPAGRSQNWVTVSMSAEGRYSILFDATMLGNGCSAVPATGYIGPAPNVTP